MPVQITSFRQNRAVEGAARGRALAAGSAPGCPLPSPSPFSPALPEAGRVGGLVGAPHFPGAPPLPSAAAVMPRPALPAVLLPLLGLVAAAVAGELPPCRVPSLPPREPGPPPAVTPQPPAARGFRPALRAHPCAPGVLGRATSRPAPLPPPNPGQWVLRERPRGGLAEDPSVPWLPHRAHSLSADPARGACSQTGSSLAAERRDLEPHTRVVSGPFGAEKRSGEVGCGDFPSAQRGGGRDGRKRALRRWPPCLSRGLVFKLLKQESRTAK